MFTIVTEDGKRHWFLKRAQYLYSKINACDVIVDKDTLHKEIGKPLSFSFYYLDMSTYKPKSEKGYYCSRKPIAKIIEP